MVRTLQSIAITLFFFVMMFFLFRDQVIPTWNRGGGIDVDRNVLTDSWANQDEWNELRLDDLKLGALRTTAQYEETGDYYAATAHLLVETPLFRGRILSSARLNHRLELQHARVRAHFPGFGQPLLPAEALDADELPPGAYELTALIDGRSIHYRLRHDDAVRHDTLPLARPATLTDSLTPILRGRMLTKNVVYALDIYDPLWGNNAGKMEIEYLSDGYELIGKDASVIRKVELRLGSNRTHLYVNDNGTIIRREIPLFASQQDAGDPGILQGSRFIAQRLEPADGETAHPDLVYTPREITVTRDDVTGEDKGELTGGLSIFTALTGSIKNQTRP